MPRPDSLSLTQRENPLDRNGGESYIAAGEICYDFLVRDVGIPGKKEIPYFVCKTGWMMTGGFIYKGVYALKKRNPVSFMNENGILWINRDGCFMISRHVQLIALQGCQSHRVRYDRTIREQFQQFGNPVDMIKMRVSQQQTGNLPLPNSIQDYVEIATVNQPNGRCI